MFRRPSSAGAGGVGERKGTGCWREDAVRACGLDAGAHAGAHCGCVRAGWLGGGRCSDVRARKVGMEPGSTDVS